MIHNHELVIIGGGQAGLAAGRHAQSRGLKFVILEASNAVGSSWRDRYDSLVLLTPRSFSGLPDLPLSGDKNGYPTRDEVVNYLREYVKNFDLNVELDHEVRKVTKDGEMFTVATESAIYTAPAVVVATGPFQTPRVPAWASPTDGVRQLHSSAYRNPAQIQGKRVLVVGGGNSGAQIAEELAAQYEVDMAVNAPMRFMPAKILGKSLFWWLDALGVLNAPSDSCKAMMLRRRGDPVIGTSLKRLLKRGAVTLKPEAMYMKDETVVFADKTIGRYDTIIYSTGYTADYRWMQIPHALDQNDMPTQEGGQSELVSGLYFLGLGWLGSRNSALLGGVGNDAKVIIDRIAGGVETAAMRGVSEANS
jgi:putative flavoprotein involved in K+ transport